MKCSACGNPHGSCTCDTPERRADQRAIEIATLEREVIDAAMERRKAEQEFLQSQRVHTQASAEFEKWQEALRVENAAVDALLAARGKP